MFPEVIPSHYILILVLPFGVLVSCDSSHQCSQCDVFANVVCHWGTLCSRLWVDVLQCSTVQWGRQSTTSGCNHSHQACQAMAEKQTQRGSDRQQRSSAYKPQRRAIPGWKSTSIPFGERWLYGGQWSGNLSRHAERRVIQTIPQCSKTTCISRWKEAIGSTRWGWIYYYYRAVHWWCHWTVQ